MPLKKKRAKKKPGARALTAMERALGRAENYWQMTGREQWADDKAKGLLDWDGRTVPAGHVAFENNKGARRFLRGDLTLGQAARAGIQLFITPAGRPLPDGVWRSV